MQTDKSGKIIPKSQAITTVGMMLEKHKHQIEAALPRHIKADRMIRVVMTSLRRTPKLMKCTTSSLLGAIVQSAQLGLEVDSGLGHAYLVPYGSQAQLIVGYQGLLDLVRRAAEVSTVYAKEVTEDDLFECEFGLELKLRHIPKGEVDPKKITHVYAVARMKDGGVQFEVMTRAEVEAIRRRSRAGQDGPWVTDYNMMARKTVLRRLCKVLPMSIEAQKAIHQDELVDAGYDQTFDHDLGDIFDDGKGDNGKPSATATAEETKPKSPEPTQTDPLGIEQQRQNLLNEIDALSDTRGGVDAIKRGLKLASLKKIETLTVDELSRVRDYVKVMEVIPQE